MDDFGGTCDAFIEADFSGTKLKTDDREAD
jgi:hypothetical protein